MKVLGIDPGIDRLGWGVLQGSGFNKIDYVSSGLITTTRSESSQYRLSEIFQDLTDLIAAHKPDIVYVEELYFAQNVSTAMIVSEVRGIIKVVMQNAGIKYFEIHPRTLKKKMTGVGNAKKNQVRYVLQSIFKFKELPKPDDVADAIAIAYVGILEQLSVL